MARILIAASPEAKVSLERILEGHQYTTVMTMSAGVKKLNAETFDLVIATLHFDDSQMFEFIREIKKCQKNAEKPIICFCSRDTPISRLLHESLEFTTSVLGAWMYLDEHSYNVYQDPAAELRRVIDRCLTDESRIEIQQKRLDIQRQRKEIQNLRKLLQEQEWSPEMRDYLAGLKHDLEALLIEVTRLHLAADARRGNITSSRDLKDRVAERVTNQEDVLTLSEENQSSAEFAQSAEEDRLAENEAIMEAEKQPKRDKITK